jgi:hypothetical protein
MVGGCEVNFVYAGFENPALIVDTSHRRHFERQLVHSMLRSESDQSVLVNQTGEDPSYLRTLLTQLIRTDSRFLPESFKTAAPSNRLIEMPHDVLPSSRKDVPSPNVITLR